MTCVIGAAVDGAYYLGADSLGAAGEDRSRTHCPKLYVFNRGAFGFTTSYRFGQALVPLFRDLLWRDPKRDPAQQSTVDEKYVRARLPALDLERDEQDLEWFARAVVPEIRKHLDDAGWLKKKEGREESGQMLVAGPWGLYTVQSDLAVLQVTNVEAVGCGYAYALGAWTATQSQFGDPVERMFHALRQAVYWSTGVGPPFRVARVGKGETKIFTSEV